MSDENDEHLRQIMSGEVYDNAPICSVLAVHMGDLIRNKTTEERDRQRGDATGVYRQSARDDIIKIREGLLVIERWLNLKNPEVE